MMTARMKITKTAFKLHGWFGLTAGFFFLLYGLTGSMLMFRKDLDRLINKDLHTLAPGKHKVSVDSIYRMIALSHPNLKKIVLHDFPVDRYDSYEFMIYQNQQKITDNYLYFVFVNPYTGLILREGSYQDITPSFFRWLYAFHYSLQLGMPGKLLTAVVGLVMLLSLLSGLIVYRKHLWDALRFKAGLNFKNARTAVSSLHRIIGVWATVSTAVLFFTGFWMNRAQFLPDEWKLMPVHTNVLVNANIDDIITKSRTVVKGFIPIAINISCADGTDIIVRGKLPTTTFPLFTGKTSGMSFDAVTGNFKALTDINKQSFNKQFDAGIYQLHIGGYGGSIVRWIYVLLGMLPGILSVTGAMLWFKKNKRR
ncbi:MAG: PepSY domain-containing protein [Pedobacter sp.]|nr:MAG: PepSY domain-containing protein [Pedobacter sp.]